MPLISRYDKTVIPWKRSTGIYGHWPRNGYKGYITIVTERWWINIWYGLKNPYRPKNGPVEWFDRKNRPKVTVTRIQ